MALSKASEWHALAKYDFAQHVLRNSGTYFPSLSEMKENEKVPDTLSGVKKRINQLENQHTSDLENLFKYQGQLYMDDALHRYEQYDEVFPAGGTQQPADAFTEARERVMEDSRRDLSREFEDHVEELRMAHLHATQPLLKRRKELEAREEAERKRRDAQFPKSVDEYHTIRNKDIQVRVARYLSADKGQQEKIMSEFGWAWRQVQPLLDTYNSNAEFKNEVHKILKDVEARDPRRRPNSMQLG
ncbi:hypothetical protein EVG20_g1720 [Dentipellis fragilis]|uniref:Uncharacterized protein n=1 Tax=Dentipellis fragilis TaxID=205917 RepID=A0A4Y9ZD02_9AGAM|nr:hypothetical protein EVG20_g1720 [Dentipellis fragilis]